MPEFLVIQLSDLHIKSHDDPIVEKWPALIAAVNAEIDERIAACAIALCGDAANAGSDDEFAAAAELLEELRRSLEERLAPQNVFLLSVPGNHDCDLTSEDDGARQAVREKTGSVVPARSIASVLLSAQRAYFEFARASVSGGTAITPDSPYYTSCDVYVETVLIRFHMLNSAWTSIKQEREDLRFPVDDFIPKAEPAAEIGICMVHHPLHWFKQPEVRRPLRDKIERCCDILLTGHEHQQDLRQIEVPNSTRITTLEGGVLQEHAQSKHSTFNIIKIDLAERSAQTRHFQWDVDHYASSAPVPTPLPLANPGRRDSLHDLSAEFAHWLDEIEDPITHPRVSLHLRDLFDFPDLRKIVKRPATVDGGSADHVVKRIRSADVCSELAGQVSSLVTGGDRSGKTSIAKTLVQELLRRGRLPVLMKGTELSRKGNAAADRLKVGACLERQYSSLSLEQYEQLKQGRKFLIVDDFQNGPSDPAARLRFLAFAADHFDTVLLLASDEFYFELLHERGEDAERIATFQRYEICDFGHRRLEALAHRWYALGQPDDADPAQIKTRASELVEQVQSVLGLAGLPHTPWLLTVVLEQSEQPDATFIAARTGNFGHLYHAVITAALTHSTLPHFDISGKFAYLAEFAGALHRANRAIMRRVDAQVFHSEHSTKYGISFDFDRVMADFVKTRLLRIDGEQIAFRSKWVYCFFVAWWINRRIHSPEAAITIKELTGRLYHETSANIVVFLAHLSDNPLVIESMRESARRLFAGSPAATLTDDVAFLNGLAGPRVGFALPATPPELNRALRDDASDEQTVIAGPVSRDGRDVDALPVGEESVRSEMHQQLNDVRAAMKTIRILGQVMRNGATSIEETAKRSLLEELMGVGRRLLGHVMGSAESTDDIIRQMRSRAFRVMVYEAKERGADADGSEVTVPPCTLSEFRSLRSDAERVVSAFWFSLHWMASYSVVKQAAEAIGIPVLDGTLRRFRLAEPSLPAELVEFAVLLNRRPKSIPSDELVELHERMLRTGNQLGRIMVEALCYERLVLFETEYADAQKICQQMGITVPVQTLDRSRKKFRSSPPHV